MKIAIISSSVRKGRLSHRVALYIAAYLKDHRVDTVEILDLAEYNFPIFEERLKFIDQPSEQTLHFADRVKNADGVVLIVPEYNGSYPASLKNVVDLLTSEWKKKPIALVSVSAGPLAGSQVMSSLLLPLWKMGAWLVPAGLTMASVQDQLDEQGIPIQKEALEKRTAYFISELFWCIEARKRME